MSTGAREDVDLTPGRCGIEVGQVWTRKPPGTEGLRIERVWQGWVHDHPELWTERAQPLHGGRVLIASPSYIATEYTLTEAAPR